MERPTTSTRLAYANKHQRFIFGALRAHRLTEAEAAFVAVELSDLKVEFGVMHGEVMQSVEDLHVGDEVRLKDLLEGFAANNQNCRRSQKSHSENHARLVSELSGCAQKHRVQLMAENGALVEVYVITPLRKAKIQPYMLLPRQFRPSDRCCVIEVSVV